MSRIAIVNYGMGNLRSVEKALERIGAEVVVTSDHQEITAADGIVLPGVGAFPRAMERIDELGLAALITGRAAAGIPVFGVCLGMQLLFERSSEHVGAEGLGLLPGGVDRLEAPGLKLPHIGWARLRIEQESPLTEGIASEEPFYFVHSFVPSPGGDDLLGSAVYADRFAALVGRDRVFGAQFHPEKSGPAGLKMLSNFAALCERAPLAAGA